VAREKYGRADIDEARQIVNRLRNKTLRGFVNISDVESEIDDERRLSRRRTYRVVA
jgi:hypothetical protein